MKPQATTIIPEGDRYVYELKYDGGSAIISRNKNQSYIAHSNNADNQIHKYPELAHELSNLPEGEYIAELCVITKDHLGGIINTFQRRQCDNTFKIMQRATQYPITAVIYDITRDGNTPVTNLGLLERKKLLADRIHQSKHIQLAKTYKSPDDLLHMKNIEGIVIKDINAPYIFGKRNGWFKYRFNKEETVRFVSYEEWEDRNGRNKGIVLATEEGFRVNLSGQRRTDAIQKINDNGHVDCEVSYYSKSNDGFRFSVIKRVL